MARAQALTVYQLGVVHDGQCAERAGAARPARNRAARGGVDAVTRLATFAIHEPVSPSGASHGKPSADAFGGFSLAVFNHQRRAFFCFASMTAFRCWAAGAFASWAADLTLIVPSLTAAASSGVPWLRTAEHWAAGSPT